jgi:hypothetical protein
MIKLITVMVMCCSFSSAFAQKELIDRLEKQAVEIDSLKKAVKTEIDSRQKFAMENSKLIDTLKMLKSDLSKLEEFRLGKKKIDTLLGQKSDSIVLLKVTIAEKDNQITAEKQKGEQKEQEKYDAGKNEILAMIANSYKSKSFDELLKSSTKESAQRDLLLFQNQAEIKQILSDIENYFNAKELLDAKLDIVQIKNVQNQLGQIKQKSTVLANLKEIIGNYQTFNDGLKETIGKIKTLDNAEEVSKLSKEVQKKKFDKILAELSSYIFNYDFNFSDYPYLSDIFLEIIKRKQPNPDADILDLLNKL